MRFSIITLGCKVNNPISIKNSLKKQDTSMSTQKKAVMFVSLIHVLLLIRLLQSPDSESIH